MSFRRAAKVTGTSIFLFASAALVAVGCGSSSPASGTGGSTGTGGGSTGTGGKGTGGKLGTGGSPGSGGAVSGAGGTATGSGGSPGTGGEVSGAGGMAQIPSCTPLPADPAMPVIFDFNDMTSTNFGDSSTVFSGSLYMFAGIPDVSTGAWKVSQDVTQYGNTGASIQFMPCPKVDLSAFTGIQLDLAGVITPMAAGVDAGTLPNQEITIQVLTAQDSVSSVYDVQNNYAPTFGTCVPTSNQYDTSCTPPSITIPLTPGPGLVTKSYLWSQILGGRGQPSGRATPDPSQILGFAFIFPFHGVVPFHIELTIDNLRLTSGTVVDASTTPDTGPTDTGRADTGPTDSGPAATDTSSQ